MNRKDIQAEVRLPAEWEPQSGVLLTWPHGAGDWGEGLGAAEAAFVRIARACARRQRVLIACLDEAHEQQVRRRLTAQADLPLERILLAVAPSNDSWARDHGPVTVLRAGKPVLLDFVFNGWGGRHAAALDNAVTRRLHARGVFAAGLEPVDLVLEGGGIDTDGEGTLLTTRGCLTSSSRNPGLDEAALSARLRRVLGLRRVLWLKHGWLAGDDTDGHIDMLARFCTTDTIAYSACTDRDDPHHRPLQAMAEELGRLRRCDGRPYRLVPLPLPAPKYDRGGRRLPATYANFLIINGAVLVPAYDDAADAVARERLARCFPGRRIVPIPALGLVHQGGGVHCAAMHFPAGVLRPTQAR